MSTIGATPVYGSIRIGPFSTITIPTSTSREFTVQGRSFFNIRAVYLSGAPYPESTFWAPFSGIPRLSAEYPGFYGIKLLSSEAFTDNDGTITFTMPSASRPGYIDIIVENEAGWGSLVQTVKKIPTPSTRFNPYVPGTTEHENYVPYERPWAKGIISVVALSSEIPVISNAIISIDGNYLVTISGEYIVPIQ